MPRDGPMQQALRDAVDKAIYSKIFDTSFTIDMPKLSPDLWDQVSVELGGDENERLEFLGDKLMDACIGIELYKTVPDGDPHKYTIMLGILHSNRTFSHVAHKMGLTKAADTKTIGDVFETIVGAYYTEKGFDAVQVWAHRLYEPLVQAASVAFDDFRSKLASTAGRGKGKRRSMVQPDIPRASGSRPRASSSPTRHRFYSAEPPNVTCEPPSTGPSNASPPDYHRTVNDDANHPPPSPPPDSDSDDDDELPDFWEAVPYPEGKILYVNHRTETTTWERPQTRKGSFHDADYSWSARLMAPLPSPPPVREDRDSTPSTTHAASAGGQDRQDNDAPPFPDLLAEGFTWENDPVGQPPGPLPDFWEARDGSDGRTYWIDHVNGTITRKSFWTS